MTCLMNRIDFRQLCNIAQLLFVILMVITNVRIHTGNIILLKRSIASFKEQRGWHD